MSLWENENNQNENGEQNNDAMEANFTVKDSGNENAGDTTDEKPTYVFENLYKNEFDRERERKKKKGMRMSGGGIAAIVALCLVVSMISGIVTGAFIGRRNTPSDAITPTDSGSSSTVTPNETTSGHESTATTSPVPLIQQAASSGNTLSPEEIAANCTDSVVVVEVVTVTTYTMFGKKYEQATRGAGSGVIYNEDGYVITNYHVASETCSSITVTTSDGKTYNAKFVVGDKDADIAVIKIKPAEGVKLTVAVLGDSDKLVVGEKVIAIGNPLGELGGTVTDGIVSALDREVLVDGQKMNLLQTNAAINEGNSGGGLFNLYGELVGVVDAKSFGTGIEGLGFVIPINDAKAVIEQLIEYGYVRGRPAIGITVYDCDMYTAWRYFGSSQPGAYIEAADSSTGLNVGDRIISIDENEISSASDISNYINTRSVGDKVKIVVMRSGKTVEVEVTLKEKVPSDTKSATN